MGSLVDPPGVGVWESEDGEILTGKNLLKKKHVK
jgi:hypothetical protein